ncbi:MAG: YicC/YloC family endoribonuclease [Treponema sp.]
MKSMTSYAYLDTNIHGIELSCELKSYNSRFLDLNIILPPWMGQLEPAIRRYCTSRIVRGKVEFYLRIKKGGAEQVIVPNIPLAESYYRSMAAIAETLGMEERISLPLILAQEGVLQFDRTFDQESWKQALMPALTALFDTFDSGRIREGSALLADITHNIMLLKQALGDIQENAAEMEQLFKESLQRKYSEITGQEADPQRIMQEIGLLLVKYTINEEIVRASAHISALEEELRIHDAAGRKIDFLCQEINREINTIGSKNQLAKIGHAVIHAKDALENIREQARNIE